MEDDIRLYKFLSTFITPRRKALFEAVLDQRTRHFVLAVEDLHKQQNASAVVRTCECLGIQELHIIEQKNPYRVASSIARGAEQWLDLHHYHESADNAQACMDSLRARGYRIVATSPYQQDADLAHFDLKQPSAIFFGEEKDGLSAQVMRQADAYLHIPIAGFTNSFNISVSAAIILHTLTERLRKRSDISWQLSLADRWRLKVQWAIHSLRNGPQLVKYFQEQEQAAH